jgi:hypothetical protein
VTIEDWGTVLMCGVFGLVVIVWGLRLLCDPSSVREGTLVYRWMKLPNRPLTSRGVRLWAIVWVIGGLLLVAVGVWVALGYWS